MADMDDMIYIWSPGGKLLWKGTFRQYLDLKGFFDRLRKRVKNILSQLSIADAITKERDHHVAMAEYFDSLSGTLVISDHFGADEFILSGDLSELEAIPELLAWFPNPEESGSGSDADAEEDAETGDEADSISAADLAAIFDGLVAMIDDLSADG